MCFPKQFKTGSRGYYANQKVEIDGKRYQVQVQFVEIGSKAADAPAVKKMSSLTAGMAR